MYLEALATTVPDACYTQAECWDMLKNSNFLRLLSRRSALVLHAILTHDSGVSTRHFAMPDLEKVFSRTPDELNQVFRAAAPALAGRALTNALEKAGARPQDLDALVVCTCTGYLCPGVSSYVGEQLGLRPDAFHQDLVGMGCGGAIPALRATDAFLRANPDALVACVAVEVCSAAFYLDDDPGVLVSACLFGDGAAASLWRAAPRNGELVGRDFVTRHSPALRDRLRFELRDGKLRNLLDATVPEVAAKGVAELFQAELARPGARPITRILAHTGGRDVLDAIEAAVPGFPLEPSRAVLRRCGNMSSPSVLFALEEALRKDSPNGDGDWWLVSFGAGFSTHACRLGR
jgi:predicted naringenin-chalcone synthase